MTALLFLFLLPPYILIGGAIGSFIGQVTMGIYNSNAGMDGFEAGSLIFAFTSALAVYASTKETKEPRNQ